MRISPAAPPEPVSSQKGRYGSYVEKEEGGPVQVNPWRATWVLSPGTGDLSVNPEANQRALLIKGSFAAHERNSRAFYTELASPLNFGFSPQVSLSARKGIGPLKEPPRSPEEKLFQRQAPGQLEGRGLGFYVESYDPEITGLEVTLAGASWGLEKPWEASATLPLPSGARKLVIPWSDFHLRSEVLADHEASHANFSIISVPELDRYAVVFPPGASFLPSAFPVHRIGLRFVRSASADPTHPRALEVRLRGPIHVDYDLDWIAQNAEDFSRSHVLRILGPERVNILKNICKKFASPDAQRYALDIIRQGEPRIAEELARYHYRIKEFPGKVSPDQFFAAFSGNDGWLPAGIEVPPFAYLHGRYTHAAQLLTLLHDSTPEEQIGIFRILSLMGNPGTTWHNLWNILFDAPGASGPNAPEWWVSRFRDEAIEAEPAAQVLSP